MLALLLRMLRCCSSLPPTCKDSSWVLRTWLLLILPILSLVSVFNNLHPLLPLFPPPYLRLDSAVSPVQHLKSHLHHQSRPSCTLALRKSSLTPVIRFALCLLLPFATTEPSLSLSPPPACFETSFPSLPPSPSPSPPTSGRISPRRSLPLPSADLAWIIAEWRISVLVLSAPRLWDGQLSGGKKRKKKDGINPRSSRNGRTSTGKTPQNHILFSPPSSAAQHPLVLARRLYKTAHVLTARPPPTTTLAFG